MNIFGTQPFNGYFYSPKLSFLYLASDCPIQLQQVRQISFLLNVWICFFWVKIYIFSRYSKSHISRTYITGYEVAGADGHVGSRCELEFPSRPQECRCLGHLDNVEDNEEGDITLQECWNDKNEMKTMTKLYKNFKNKWVNIKQSMTRGAYFLVSKCR